MTPKPLFTCSTCGIPTDCPKHLAQHQCQPKVMKLDEMPKRVYDDIPFISMDSWDALTQPLLRPLFTDILDEEDSE